MVYKRSFSFRKSVIPFSNQRTKTSRPPGKRHPALADEFIPRDHMQLPRRHIGDDDERSGSDNVLIEARGAQPSRPLRIGERTAKSCQCSSPNDDGRQARALENIGHRQSEYGQGRRSREKELACVTAAHDGKEILFCHGTFTGRSPAQPSSSE